MINPQCGSNKHPSSENQIHYHYMINDHYTCMHFTYLFPQCYCHNPFPPRWSWRPRLSAPKRCSPVKTWYLIVTWSKATALEAEKKMSLRRCQDTAQRATMAWTSPSSETGSSKSNISWPFLPLRGILVTTPILHYCLCEWLEPDIGTRKKVRAHTWGANLLSCWCLCIRIEVLGSHIFLWSWESSWDSGLVVDYVVNTFRWWQPPSKKTSISRKTHGKTRIQQQGATSTCLNWIDDREPNHFV